MASYSKIFKASALSLSDEIKVYKEPFTPLRPKVMSRVEEPVAGNEMNIEQMFDEANAKASEILQAAEAHAHKVKAEAEQSIQQWWNENQAKLESMSTEAMQQGYEEGYTEGRQEAEERARNDYKEMLEEARTLLDEAYQQKEKIISEAEPFLLELSTVIASQIIKQELDASPEKFVGLIQEHIMRFKEKDYITVCVHPADFEFIQSQRSHLVSIVNGETEIKIVPDHSVTKKGCIIRTAYGSVDARIDTQIEEIKRVILDAKRGEPKDDIGD